MSPIESIHRHQCPATRALAQLSGGGSETLWWVLFCTVMMSDRRQSAAHRDLQVLGTPFWRAELAEVQGMQEFSDRMQSQTAHCLTLGAIKTALSLLSAANPLLQALGDLLKTTHRGYFIPPRPEKNPVEGQRASADFVEGRRTALQHYLEQLAAHPVISQSEVLVRSDEGSCKHVHLVLKNPHLLLHCSLMWPG